MSVVRLSKSPTPPYIAIREEQTLPVVVQIEEFLHLHLRDLPHHRGTSEKYKQEDLKRKYWRALILTWNYKMRAWQNQHWQKVNKYNNLNRPKNLYQGSYFCE
jgi:hypothetical protein